MLRNIRPDMKITDGAKKEVRRMTERFVMDILQGAIDIARVAKRKTVMRQDIIVAKRQLVKRI